MSKLSEYVSIERTVRSFDEEPAAYLEPPFAILTATSMQPEEIITTAICWMLKKRPIIVPVKQLVLTGENLETLHKVEKYPKSDQVIIFIGMAGLMTLAKEIHLSGKPDYDYLQKRWHAICTTLGIEDVIATQLAKRDMYIGLMNVLVSWQNWIKPRATIRKHFLDLALQEQPSGTPALVKQALLQVKMILHNFGMKTILLMDNFIYSKTKAVMLPAIAQQAADLRKALTDLYEKYKEKFHYLKVYPLEGAERIYCKTYPDLYYATIMAVNNKTLKELKCTVNNLYTSTPKHIIKSLLKKKMKIPLDVTVPLNRKYLRNEFRLPQQTYHIDEDEDHDNSFFLKRRYF